MQTTDISFQRDVARDRVSKEFSRTVHEIESALKQLKHHWAAFNEGNDTEKADRVSLACGEIRRMASHIDIAYLADMAARLDVLANLDS